MLPNRRGSRASRSPPVLDGVITGGWSYVIVSYAVTVVAMLVYAWSLGVRRKNLNRARTRRKNEA